MKKERLPFRDRAVSMGLRNIGNECFEYFDITGGVLYKHLQSKDTLSIPLTEDHSIFDIPLYAVFTKPPTQTSEYTYAGYVSNLYQFEGNEIMNNSIRQSILSVGTPIFREYIYMSGFRTRMVNDILIQNQANVPKVGDVYPQVTVKNTYDGSGAREYSFGFSILEQGNRKLGFSFQNKLGKVRQVHSVNSIVSASTSISNYTTVFSTNITNIISTNLNTEITEDHLLNVFKMLEDIGKKKVVDVSGYVESLSKESNGKINAWNLFTSIAYFSTIEKNINIKTLLNNIAEKVLVIPVQIQNVLDTIH